MSARETKREELKVGDVVLWQEKKTSGNQPLGIANCEIIEIGTATDGAPAAKIKLLGFGGQTANAYLKDLHRQRDSQ